MNTKFLKNLKSIGLIQLTILFLSSCGGNSSPTTEEAKISTTEFLKGKKIYEARCANCHKNSGTGMGTLYPPIAQSDYLINNIEKVICSIKYGENQEIVVNGKTYKMPMPPQADLNEVEISDVMNYIMNSWGNKMGPITLKKVEETLAKCK